jgi:hypothetical protein
VGSFICIGPRIEEGEPSSCGGAPRGVVLGGHKILPPPCVLRLKTYNNVLRAVELERSLLAPPPPPTLGTQFSLESRSKISCRSTKFSMLKNNTKFKFSTIVTRTDVITHGMLHGLYFIALFGVLLGFHINVGTEFVPNTRLDPLISL